MKYKNLIIASLLATSLFTVGCQTTEPTEPEHNCINAQQQADNFAISFKGLCSEQPQKAYQIVSLYQAEDLIGLEELKNEEGGSFIATAYGSLNNQINNPDICECEQAYWDAIDQVLDGIDISQPKQETYEDTEVNNCANCGSSNIDVVDHTGGYICNECGYME